MPSTPAETAVFRALTMSVAMDFWTCRSAHRDDRPPQSRWSDRPRPRRRAAQRRRGAPPPLRRPRLTRVPARLRRRSRRRPKAPAPRRPHRRTRLTPGGVDPRAGTVRPAPHRPRRDPLAVRDRRDRPQELGPAARAQPTPSDRRPFGQRPPRGLRTPGRCPPRRGPTPWSTA